MRRLLDTRKRKKKRREELPERKKEKKNQFYETRMGCKKMDGGGACVPLGIFSVSEAANNFDKRTLAAAAVPSLG